MTSTPTSSARFRRPRRHAGTRAHVAAPSRARPRAEPTAVDAKEVIAHPAGFFRRVIAFTFDTLFLCALFAGLFFALSKLGKAPKLPSGMNPLDLLATSLHDSAKLIGAVAVMCVGIAAAYTTLCAAAFKGRTLGRAIAGVRLVDRRGRPPSPFRALARALLSLVSFGVVFVGFWLGLLDRRGQTLHDKLCSTFVVRLGARRT